MDVLLIPNTSEPPFIIQFIIFIYIFWSNDLVCLKKYKLNNLFLLFLLLVLRRLLIITITFLIISE